MKAKTIKAVLHKKINQWADSIEDIALRDLVQKNTIVTGGAIASMLLKEPVNDYDIYFRTKECVQQVAQYYADRFVTKNKKGIPCKIFVETKNDIVSLVIKSAGIASEEGTDKPYEYFEGAAEGEGGDYVSDVIQDPGMIEDTYEETKKALHEDLGLAPYRPVFLTSNAITLSNQIQIVLRFYGEPDTIHENYDFQHCTNYWTSWENKLVLKPEALECLLTKELKYVGSKYPVSSVIRLRKFIQRGWNVNAGQIVKMALQISELDLTDYKTLREQLLGVDCAYFAQLLNEVRADNPEKINSAYIIEIIDRIF